MAANSKNLPILNPDIIEFWKGCKREVLLIQKCRDCGKYRHEPRIACPYCLSFNFDWTEVSGKGEVYSYVIYRRPPFPNWSDAIPYVVAIIELEDCSVRMVSNIVECKPEEVKIGMKVEVVFEKATEEITLPKFRPAGL